jgi:hypothetical protein
MTTFGGMAVAVAKLSLVVAVCILGAPLGAGSQPASNIHRVGYLSNSSFTTSARQVEAFRQGLRELGWVEGRTSSSTFDLRKARLTGCPHSQLSWYRARWV